MATTPALPDFAATDQIAEARFECWRDRDPFPTVSPALLNSADLLDYVATAGMLSPYVVTPQTRDELVKPASCAVACTGDVLRFGFDKAQREVVETERRALDPQTPLVLPANSITYLHLGTTFRIPEYIAARFNLAIREIHRGFLVGTGPLVDPGFVGRLFIPLHNLTSNEYRVRYGEPIVWVEFTKLSPHANWRNGRPQPRAAQFVPFPRRKLARRTPEQYLWHANEGRPIASSIPEQFETAIAVAQGTERRVNRYRNIAIVGTFLTAVALLFGVVLPMVNLVSDTNTRLDALEKGTARLPRAAAARHAAPTHGAPALSSSVSANP